MSVNYQIIAEEKQVQHWTTDDNGNTKERAGAPSRLDIDGYKITASGSDIEAVEQVPNKLFDTYEEAEHEAIAQEIADNLTHADETLTLDELEKSHFAHEDMLNLIYTRTDKSLSNEKKNEIINRAFEIARNNQN